jgi:hypothetical protein
MVLIMSNCEADKFFSQIALQSAFICEHTVGINVFHFNATYWLAAQQSQTSLNNTRNHKGGTIFLILVACPKDFTVFVLISFFFCDKMTTYNVYLRQYQITSNYKIGTVHLASLQID